MLNQTNLVHNNNKFFLIQVLKRKNGKGFATWFRWGRVGYPGQTNLQEFEDLDKSVSVFEQKFSDKTHNEWFPGIHQKFKSHHGKYTLLAVETLTRAVEDASGAGEMKICKIEYEETKLEEAVHDLIKLISSKDMFERELKIAGIDLTKMPLGQISARMIKEGYGVLKEIESELLQKGGRREVLLELSNKFYTVIPHNFGFTKVINYAINSFAKMKEKIELIESLGQVMESRAELKEEKLRVDVSLHPNPVDDHYRRIGKEILHVHANSPEFKLIQRYKENTQGPTHSSRTRIRNVFRFASSKPPTSSSTLLWHGSRLTNWYSILAHGLKIAPPEAPHTGFMFDKGIYFADCFSKSANYCFASGAVGLLVLCEVELGNARDALEADYEAKSKLGSSYHSTKGVGQHFPDPAGGELIENGKVLVPCGKLLKRLEQPTGRRSIRMQSSPLLYNEFVVYDPARVRIRYIVEVEFGRG